MGNLSILLAFRRLVKKVEAGLRLVRLTRKKRTVRHSAGNSNNDKNCHNKIPPICNDPSSLTSSTEPTNGILNNGNRPSIDTTSSLEGEHRRRARSRSVHFDPNQVFPENGHRFSSDTRLQVYKATDEDEKEEQHGENSEEPTGSAQNNEDAKKKKKRSSGQQHSSNKKE